MVRIPLSALLLMLLSALPVRAERHAADSGPAVLDALPPVVTLHVPAGGEIYYGNDQQELSWTVQETHHAPVGHTARVTAAGDTVSVQAFASQDGVHTWDWDVPDVSAGDARLAVTHADSFGNRTTAVSEPFIILLQNTGVGDAPPAVGGLTGARPNPFNPATVLDFALAADGPARLTVHDLRGRTVRTLLDRPLGAGRWSVRWDGRDDGGRALPAAAYLARLNHAGRNIGVRKVVLLP